MARTVVIKPKKILLWSLLGLFCAWQYIISPSTCNIEDVSKKAILKAPAYLIMPVSCSMHFEGYLDGESEFILSNPGGDINKERFCSDTHYYKLKPGKVDTYFQEDIGSTGMYHLLYIPCTAKKGHLKMTVSFSQDLRRKTIWQKIGSLFE